MKQELGIFVEAFTERYLGLPTAVARITSGTFDHIGERSRGKMQGWAPRNLACAGREILLKSVIQAIPTYGMSCFQLTKKVCKQLTSCMAPKIKGGMGFREFENFKLALLGKHGWRLLTHPESLCSRVLKGKYFPTCEFMQAQAPKSASATWKAIIAGRSALEKGLIKRVGSGESISIWNDRWIPTTTTFKPMGHLGNAPWSMSQSLSMIILEHGMLKW